MKIGFSASIPRHAQKPVALCSGDDVEFLCTAPVRQGDEIEFGDRKFKIIGQPETTASKVEDAAKKLNLPHLMQLAKVEPFG
ncbi:MAG: hypothetical protein ACRD2S_07820, partial [Terriglobales bacterium]